MVAATNPPLRVLLSVVIAAVNLTMLAPYSVDFTRAATSAGQLFKLIDRKSAIDPFTGSGEQPPETTGIIELEDVTFAYPTRPGITVLDKFSLKVPAGKVTALVVGFVSQTVFLFGNRLTSEGPKRFWQKYHRGPDREMV